MGMTSAGFAAWHELRQFVSQTELDLIKAAPVSSTLFPFKDGYTLISRHDVEAMSDALVRFLRDGARLVEEKANLISWNSGGPAIDGIGLERHLIANELLQRLKRSLAPIEPAAFTADVTGVLSFLSQVSQRRYEQVAPQFTVVYYPQNRDERPSPFGSLGKPLLDDYKALLRLCRDGRSGLAVGQGLRVIGFEDTSDATSSERTPLLPRRLAPLGFKRSGTPRIVFNLNENGTQEVLLGDEAVFRYASGRWRLVLIVDALKQIQNTLRPTGKERVARNVLALAQDLADAGEGALLFLCERPTTDVLRHLLFPDGLIGGVPGPQLQERTARERFTELVGSRAISLDVSSLNECSPLLRNICGIDGSTVFSYAGQLLGFGCIVRQRASARDRGAAEGARTTAAKTVSSEGIALKISSDGTANLYIAEQEWGAIW